MPLRDIFNFKIVLGHLMEHIFVSKCLMRMHQDIGGKGYPTQNLLEQCSFDLKFTYVLLGWEGIASDSRIIKSALIRNNNLKIPLGKLNLNTN